MSKHDDRPDSHRGAQSNAEGQHGDKTHDAFIDNLHNPRDQGAEAASRSSNDFDEFGRPHPGHHRLSEDREQHDPAEKDSEIKHERR
jgi:hypothetical protein